MFRNHRLEQTTAVLLCLSSRIRMLSSKSFPILLQSWINFKHLNIDILHDAAPAFETDLKKQTKNVQLKLMKFDLNVMPRRVKFLVISCHVCHLCLFCLNI